jgi:Na+/H+ antiporter NhaD/arsenite permease-like protein
MQQRQPVGLAGGANLLLLAAVVASVALLVPGRAVPGTSWLPPPYLREGVVLLSALASWKLALFTPKGLRERVGFDFAAINEVACLFIGIFITMQVPLELLHDPDTVASLGVNSPASFLWVSGGLSSVLDNAPTYVVFFETAKGLPPLGDPLALPDGVISEPRLVAISCGAVLFGAMTYIGNGPNLLVRAIAEQAGVRMPSFAGYLRYSLIVLLPVFALVSWLFF